MNSKFRKMVLAGFASLMVLAAQTSGASAESRNGRMLPSREMMHDNAMQRPMMHRHHRMSRHHMMRPHHRMRHHRM